MLDSDAQIEQRILTHTTSNRHATLTLTFASIDYSLACLPARLLAYWLFACFNFSRLYHVTNESIHVI